MIERPLPITLLKYTTGNIGDDIQTLAVLRQIGKADYFVDRDELGSCESMDPSILILNGWFGKKTNFKVPENISPLFISCHISRGTRTLKQELLKYEPIGCRDPVTRDKLRMQGIRAFYTGCMTLTFENSHSHRKGGVYMVGVHEEVEHLVPRAIRDKAERVKHVVDQRASMEERFSFANDLLDRYAQAELVVTSLLHCALPCLAFGTPVVLLHRSPHVARISTAARYLKIWGPKDNPDQISFCPDPPSVASEANMLKRLLRAGIANRGDFQKDISLSESLRLGISPFLRYGQAIATPISYLAGALWTPYKREMISAMWTGQHASPVER